MSHSQNWWETRKENGYIFQLQQTPLITDISGHASPFFNNLKYKTHHKKMEVNFQSTSEASFIITIYEHMNINFFQGFHIFFKVQFHITFLNDRVQFIQIQIMWGPRLKLHLLKIGRFWVFYFGVIHLHLSYWWFLYAVRLNCLCWISFSFICCWGKKMLPIVWHVWPLVSLGCL